MCLAMASGIQNQEGVPENLRKQLAIAVRSIQWSYAIFWSLSTTQQGVLEWNDGYYNGDIKTRRTVQDIELKADKVGFQRSEQLRELYESLLESDTDQEAKRPATLTPEDLTDAEWYYLVCMSFVFSPGQGLPGRALGNGQPVWLCNAHYADSKVFSRSLLAKSASIQTVICFSHLGGVIELGVAELVLEDPTLIQHIKASLLEFSKPVCSDKSYSPPDNVDDDKDPICAKVDNEIVDSMGLENFYSPSEDIKFDQEGFNELEGNIHEDYTMGSPDECSHRSEQSNQTEDSMLDAANAGASQVRSWHFMDDDFSNCVQVSMDSSNCISQAFVSQEKAISPPRSGNINNLHLKELQECNHTKLSSMDLGTNDDLHYRRTLSTIMRNSHLLRENLGSQSCDYKSSFLIWKKGVKADGLRPPKQQSLLKKILFNVPLMHGGCLLKSPVENGGKDLLWKLGNDEIYVQHALPHKRAENEKFLVLRSMIPSIRKIDKASILDDTIEYLKELQARIEELEPCVDLAESEARTRMKYPDMVEQTSDNYDNRKVRYGMKPLITKRKACDIDGTGPELNSVVPKDGLPLDMKVRINEQEVLIEMRCPSREYLLLDIIDAINNLNLDAHSVQSSILDGFLTLTIQSKVRGAAVASARMIKQALWKVAGKC